MIKPHITGQDYFVGHQLTPENIDDLRAAISRIFDPLGYKPFYADKGVEGKSLLLKICQKVYLSRFGIFDLSIKNPNVYLELGIALGLNRPVIAIARSNAEPSSFLVSHAIIFYDGFFDLEAQLSKLCEQGFPTTSVFDSNYCHFCQQTCRGLLATPDEKSCLILDSRPTLSYDLKNTLRSALSERQFELFPLSSSIPDIPILCGVRKKVSTCQFAIADLTTAAENDYLALGIVIGAQVPWLLLAHKDQTTVPSNLQGFDRIEYESFSALKEKILPDFLDDFLEKFILGYSVTASGSSTAKMSLPFWEELSMWIDSSNTEIPQSYGPSIGRLKLVQRSPHFFSKIISQKKLQVGRNDDCDMVFKAEAVSSKHYCVWRRRDNRYFIMDSSTNGTWHNGTRLPKGKPVELKARDKIWIPPGVSFWIWDDQPLPDEDPISPRGDAGFGTAILNLPRIKIPGILPPPFINPDDRTVTLKVLDPKGEKSKVLETETYYQIEEIIAQLIDLMGLPEPNRKTSYGYRLEWQGTYLDEHKTLHEHGFHKREILIALQIVEHRKEEDKAYIALIDSDPNHPPIILQNFLEHQDYVVKTASSLNDIDSLSQQFQVLILGIISKPASGKQEPGYLIAAGEILPTLKQLFGTKLPTYEDLMLALSRSAQEAPGLVFVAKREGSGSVLIEIKKMHPNL